MSYPNKDERTAAYREAARSVAAALLGFTLQAASVLPTSDTAESHGLGFTAFKERNSAETKDLLFMSVAGEWFAFEAIESSVARENAQLALLSKLRTFEDSDEIAFNLRFLIENYSKAVFALADELAKRKVMNGIECGKIIQAHAPKPGHKTRPV
jgi:hypothetical protein